jgi:putative intracellular protease/amidase
MKSIIVLTSHSELEHRRKTGFWVEEFAAPYYELADKGVVIDIATPLGGQPPIDPKSVIHQQQQKTLNDLIKTQN